MVVLIDSNRNFVIRKLNNNTRVTPRQGAIIAAKPSRLTFKLRALKIED